MREIKFRAWEKKDKRMIYDGDIYIPELFRGDSNFQGCFEGVRVTNKGLYWWFCSTRAKKRSEDSFDHVQFEWERIELMQSTELKDRNNKEIFEGDIIREIQDEPSKRKPYLIEAKIPMIYFEGWVTFAEIIGNIYENPELLEGGKP